MPSTSERARALVEAAGKATPGPWRFRRRDGSPSGDNDILGWDWDWKTTGTCVPPEPMRGVFAKEDDAKLVEAGRNDAPDIARALLEAVEIIEDFTISSFEDDIAAGHSEEDAVTRERARRERARAWLAKHEGGE